MKLEVVCNRTECSNYINGGCLKNKIVLNCDGKCIDFRVNTREGKDKVYTAKRRG